MYIFGIGGKAMSGLLKIVNLPYHDMVWTEMAKQTDFHFTLIYRQLLPQKFHI